MQLAEGSDDFQEFGSDNKGVNKRLTIDATLEDKICDIYDLYVDVRISLDFLFALCYLPFHILIILIICFPF